MVDIHILPTREIAAQATAEYVASVAEDRARTQGRFTVALSGGSTPRLLYERLASPPYAEQIAWDSWHVFWGDERCVPPNHKDSNYRMARDSFLDRVAIPPTHIHRMRGEVASQTGAEEYEAAVREVFQEPMPSFDLILLGIGEDGHTASLFPGTQALQEQHRLVVTNRAPHPADLSPRGNGIEAQRITFTLPLINAARVVTFLVTEESKAEVLRQVLRPTPDALVLPAALVRPVSGAVHWFLTPAAASQLQEVSVLVPAW